MPSPSGETNVPVGDWTTGTLKIYHDGEIAHLKELMYKLREADQIALQAALISNEKRLDALNELRQGVATTAQLEGLEKIIDDLKDRMNRNDGRGVGVNASWGYLLGGLGGVATIIGVILAFNN